MTRKEFRKRIGRVFPGLDIEFTINEAEYLASVRSDPNSTPLICQSSPYRDEISTFWRGQPAGLL